MPQFDILNPHPISKKRTISENNKYVSDPYLTVQLLDSINENIGKYVDYDGTARVAALKYIVDSKIFASQDIIVSYFIILITDEKGNPLHSVGAGESLIQEVDIQKCEEFQWLNPNLYPQYSEIANKTAGAKRERSEK